MMGTLPKCVSALHSIGVSCSSEQAPPLQVVGEGPLLARDTSDISSLPGRACQTTTCFRPLSLLCVVSLLWLLVSACTPFANPFSTANNPATAVAKTPTRLVPVGPTGYPVFVDKENYCSGEDFCMPPQNMRDAYGITPLLEQGYTGKWQAVIIIASFGNPKLQHDLDVYDAKFHLPAITVQQISPLNVPVSDPENQRLGWEVETALDVEVVHALAPDAHIVVLNSPVAEIQGISGLPKFRQLYHYAIEHKLGSVISKIWNANESTLQDAAGQAEVQQWDTMLKQAVTEAGITVLGASRDGFHIPTFPNDDPWVIRVGGSSLQHTGNQLSELPGYIVGGGQSAFFAEPPYQKLLSVGTQNLLQNKQSMPDVGADSEAGLPIYNDGNGGMREAPAKPHRSGQR